MDTDFGIVIINVKALMDSKGISVYKMSRLTNVKYDIIKKHYDGETYSCSYELLAKFCYILDCHVDDVIVYYSNRNQYIH